LLHLWRETMKNKRHTKPIPKNKPVPKTNFFVNLIGRMWNTLGKAKRWVVQNPKKSIIAVLLASTAVVVWKLINQNSANTTVAVNSEGQPLQATPQPICPVMVFYETHSDKAPAEMIITLFPNFVESGYKTFLFEEPTGTSLPENIRNWESSHLKLTNNLNAGLYQGDTLNFLKTYLESLKTSLGLLKRIKEVGLNYEAIDLDTKTGKEFEARFGLHSEETFTKRDNHMAARIQESCAQHGGGQVVLVGVMHNGIEQRLQKAGYTNLSSTYIIDHAPTTYPSLPAGRQDNDVQLRTKNLLYMKKYGYENTNIINVYDKPNTNVTKEVLSGLRKRTPIKGVSYL
jgi:hypothetical protein